MTENDMATGMAILWLFVLPILGIWKLGDILGGFILFVTRRLNGKGDKRSQP